MSKRTIQILFGIFIVFLCICLYPLFKEKMLKQKEVKGAIDFTFFTEQNTDRISIKKGESSLLLQKENSLWKINGFNASLASVNSFFSSIQNIKTQNLVSKNPDNHKSLGVSEDEGYVIAFTQNKVDFSFIFSAKGATGSDFYVKKDKSDEVYLTDAVLPQEIFYTADDWRDKTIAQIKKEQIQRIEIYLASKNYQILQQDKKFVLIDGQENIEISQANIDLISNSLSDFSGDGYLTEEQKKELDATKDKIVIKIFDFGNNVLLETYLLDKNDQYWLKVAGNNEYYFIEKSSLPEVLLKPEELIK